MLLAKYVSSIYIPEELPCQENCLGKIFYRFKRILSERRLAHDNAHWEGKRVFGAGGNLGFGRDGSHAEFAAVPGERLVELPRT
jgi:hypothetical protein